MRFQSAGSTPPPPVGTITALHENTIETLHLADDRHGNVEKIKIRTIVEAQTNALPAAEQVRMASDERRYDGLERDDLKAFLAYYAQILLERHMIIVSIRRATSVQGVIRKDRNRSDGMPSPQKREDHTLRRLPQIGWWVRYACAQDFRNALLGCVSEGAKRHDPVKALLLLYLGQRTIPHHHDARDRRMNESNTLRHHIGLLVADVSPNGWRIP